MLKKLLTPYAIFNLLVVLFLLWLPYYLFGNRLYLGGDDTKLFYSYPWEYIHNVVYFSWFNVSSIGTNGTNQYLLPFLLLTMFVKAFIPNVTILNHLAFSLPFILGLLYFQKMLRELFNIESKYNLEIFLGSLFYILSPILIINQMFVFLISVWVIALIPIIAYFYLKYLKTYKFKYVFIGSIWCFLLSVGLYAIPWWSGLVLPLILGFGTTLFLYKTNELSKFFKKSIIFFGFIGLSQAYWLTSFLSTYLALGQNSFSSKFLSKGFVNTFIPTVTSTATSTIIYPLLNLFHRQIAFDFKWKLQDVFTSFYDKTFILNIVYIIIFGFGILLCTKFLDKNHRKLYLGFLLSFLISLYLFTVNIGPLENLFIFLRHIPGFVMYRNFYDKFAPGYVILYAVVITISLVMISRRYPKRRWIFLSMFFLLIIINFLPVKATVDSALWTTNDIKREISIPKEYFQTMDYIKKNISSTNTILSIPFGSSAYSQISEADGKHAYVGVSPIRIFSGVNDLSGHLSFNFTDTANTVDGIIATRNYNAFNNILFQHNVNYVLLTKNLPQQVLNSWVYNKNMVAVQDKKFIDSITGKKIYFSSSGTYEIYTTKKMNSLINSENVYFEKISQVKYKIYIKNLSSSQLLSFVDSYHPGWKLYLQKNPSLDFCKDGTKNPATGSIECKAQDELFSLSDLGYLWERTVFQNSHSLIYDYANRWTIDGNYIRNNFSNNYYSVNKDGTINIEMVLYFQPQTYFYLGTLITLIVMSGGLAYLIYSKKRDKRI